MTGNWWIDPITGNSHIQVVFTPDDIFDAYKRMDPLDRMVIDSSAESLADQLQSAQLLAFRIEQHIKEQQAAKATGSSI